MFLPEEDVAGEEGTEAARGLLGGTSRVDGEGPGTADKRGLDAALGDTIESECGRGGTIRKGGARAGFVGVSGFRDPRAYCIVKDGLPA